MEERRQYVRLNEGIKIGYKRVSSWEKKEQARTKNISGEGICIPLAEKLEPGVTVDLEIYLSAATAPLKATGEIVWCHVQKNKRLPYLAGIQFAKIDTFDRNVIFSFIRQKMTGKGHPKSQSEIRLLGDS